MRLNGKFAQDHELSEKTFVIQTFDPRNLKKMAK